MKYLSGLKLLIYLLLISILFVSFIGFSTSDGTHPLSFEHNEISSAKTTENAQSQKHCEHSFYFDFDDDSMTVTNVYEGGRVSSLLEDVRFYKDNHYATIRYNNQEITEGLLKEGMIVEIYHDNNLYGEYTIEQLLPLGDSNKLSVEQTGPVKATAANAYGFILPIDNMNLTSNISYGFGAGNPPHRGIDVRWSGINGTPVRAVKSGTVEKAEYHYHDASWGYYVKINHGNGLSTLYAHMQDDLKVSKGSMVTAGQIVGYVGATGYVEGINPYHLHFEVCQGSNLQNPITYLTGAPSYAGSHTHTYRFVWYEGTHPHQNYEQCTSCGELRGMGTYAASYTNTYYEKAHPHKYYGTCKICATGHYTGETAACNQVALYYEKAHPHPKVRVLACGATEFTGTYEPCRQVGLYYEKEHPHKRIRELACGATEFTGTYEPCRQVGLYYEKEHPHQRVRELACGATEYLDSYGACTCS